MVRRPARRILTGLPVCASFILFHLVIPGCSSRWSPRCCALSRRDAAPTISIRPAPGTTGDLERRPGRLYVTGRENRQVRPAVILKTRGWKPGTRLFWSFNLRRGPHHPQPASFGIPFSECPGHPYDAWEDATVADARGESEVRATLSSYAGDRFQFAVGFRTYVAGFSDESAMSRRFRNAVNRTPPVEVWKCIRFESPKVLTRVRYPASIWDLVAANLATLNIELRVDSRPVTLSPADPTISHYFHTRPDDPLHGAGEDPRYGPQGYGSLDQMLGRINRLFNDGDTRTINLFLLGAPSQARDLIRSPISGSRTPPQPVDHEYSYRPQEFDMAEWSVLGTGVSLAGDNPAIFIWADFWWVASKTLGVAYDKALARVLLHEIGHHLMHFRTGGPLDATGHISSLRSGTVTVMSGSVVETSTRHGRTVLSRGSLRRERLFIECPRWHREVEILIRRDYTPPSSGTE